VPTFGESTWVNNGEDWLIRASNVLPDGSRSTAENVLTKVDDNKFTWESQNRTLNGEPQPSLDKTECKEWRGVDNQEFLMKRVLFRILVLGLGALMLLAQTESFAARGGGGRGGGGGGGRAVSRGGGGGYSRAGGMGGGGRGGGSSRPSVSRGGYGGGGSRAGQTRNVSRSSGNRAGGMAPNRNITGGNINRSQASSKIQSRPKGSGSGLPSVAQGNKPGAGARGNKGFPNIADKTGGGQLAGRGQGAGGGQLAGRGQGAGGGQLAGRGQGAGGGQLAGKVQGGQGGRLQGSQLGAVVRWRGAQSAPV
jgi:hypothetical protein